MAVGSTSTDAEVWAEFDDTALYEVDADPDLARRHIAAATILLRRRPLRADRSGAAIQFSSEPIQKSLDTALAWWRQYQASASGAGGGAKYLSLEGFR